ncbi:MAG: tRNA lysidine(34) synthetase TilS [Phycisphaerales bacterium]|nr:tRNA lysidine(34) synthetase TilS [Phycisphaerales bacterium]
MNAGAIQSRAKLRRDPGVRSIIAAWRRLTGGRARRDPERRTLVACSGGADSSALALSLASASRGLVIAHVLHDLRPIDQATADRDAACALAQRLGVPFVEASIRPARAPGNAESNARRLRYAALTRLAREHECPFVAVAHHADDAVETLLMRLIRGTGPQGLGGMHEARPLAPSGPTLIRPMLDVTREEVLRICTNAGWIWNEDQTNQDVKRLRAAIRARVLPVLRDLSPGMAKRTAKASVLLAQNATLARETAAALLEQTSENEAPNAAFSLDRMLLRGQSPLVLGEVVRQAARLLGGAMRLDRLNAKSLEAVVRAMKDESNQPREFTLAGLRVAVRSKQVLFVRRATSDRQTRDASPERRQQHYHRPEDHGGGKL